MAVFFSLTITGPELTVLPLPSFLAVTILCFFFSLTIGGGQQTGGAGQQTGTSLTTSVTTCCTIGAA